MGKTGGQEGCRLKLKYLLSVWLVLTAVTFFVSAVLLGHHDTPVRTAFMSMLYMFWPSAIICLIMEGLSRRKRAK